MWEFLWVDRIRSTNDTLLQLASCGKAREGTVLIAKEQTRGKGRCGRRWVGVRGDLAMSLLTSGEVGGRLLVMGMGVAIAQCCREWTGCSPKIKWPNDLFFGDYKIAGILAESVLLGAEEYYVLGLGMNVVSSPKEGISLGCFCPAIPRMEDIVQMLLNRFSLCLKMTQKCGTEWLVGRWNNFAWGRGSFLTIQVSEGKYRRGLFEGLNRRGLPVLRGPSGGLLPMLTGRVVMRPPKTFP